MKQFALRSLFILNVVLVMFTWCAAPFEWWACGKVRMYRAALRNFDKLPIFG